MRPIVLVVLPLLLGCNRQPDFDERYEAAERQIQERADSIDREIEAGTHVSDKSEQEHVR